MKAFHTPPEDHCGNYVDFDVGINAEWVRGTLPPKRIKKNRKAMKESASNNNGNGSNSDDRID